jgi:uncharacterized protein (DUF934 family)
MATLIRRGRTCNENWRLFDAAALENGALPASDEAGVTGILIPLAAWRDRPERWSALRSGFGVVLQATDDPALLGPDLGRIPLIAIQFARFNDGRGYSIGRLLRSRYGYRGELRAIGEVLRDQLFYLKRVGFDAFELRADQDVDSALRAFDDFSECYQGAVDPVLPLFRRRVA